MPRPAVSHPMAICSIADVEDILSAEGVRQATDDDRTGGGDCDKVQNAIARATAFFMTKVYKFYAQSALEGNEFCRWCVAYMAIGQLFKRRGNYPPPAIQEEIEGWSEHLEKIEEGTAEIPGASRRYEQTGMSMSNLRYDQRYQVAKVRVESTISTGPRDQTKLPRRFDRRSYVDFEL